MMHHRFALAVVLMWVQAGGWVGGVGGAGVEATSTAFCLAASVLLGGKETF